MSSVPPSEIAELREIARLIDELLDAEGTLRAELREPFHMNMDAGDYFDRLTRTRDDKRKALESAWRARLPSAPSELIDRLDRAAHGYETLVNERDDRDLPSYGETIRALRDAANALRGGFGGQPSAPSAP